MNSFRPVIVVPHYNHVGQFESSLPQLLKAEVPVLVVDDGSAEPAWQTLQLLSARHGFELIRHTSNEGKGAAVMTGFRVATERGYTHALQIDADGQHNPEDIPPFVACAERLPHTIICGAPVFGSDAPLVRRWGRKLTDAVVFLETWTVGIRDSLCGFRVYPLAEMQALIEAGPPGRGMDFDAEILVLANWRGTALHFEDTQVMYPAGGVSHFRYLRDNARMILMHTRLMLRMLLRSPWLLWRAVSGQRQLVI